MTREQHFLGPIVSTLCLIVVLGSAGIATADYQGPVAATAAADGKTVFVANRDAKQLAVVDVAGNKVAQQIARIRSEQPKLSASAVRATVLLSASAAMAMKTAARTSPAAAGARRAQRSGSVLVRRSVSHPPK